MSMNKLEKISSLFKIWDTNHTPGCAVLIVKDGEELFAKGYGIAHLDYGIPISLETKFYIASMTKQFTAACIALLVLDGRLDLDDQISKWFPEIKSFNRPIKIKDLVYHTSGLRDTIPLSVYAGADQNNQDFKILDDVIALISRQKSLDFPTGTDFKYSNAGYSLLAKIVELVSGKDIDAFAQERIFLPLGMLDTSFDNNHSRVIKNRAVSYTKNIDGSFKTLLNNSDACGDTGIITTARDLAKWDNNFYTGQVGGQKFINLMYKNGQLDNGEKIEYAFGLFVKKVGERSVVEHAGSIQGFRSQMVRYPEDRLTIICLSNIDVISPSAYINKISDSMFDKESDQNSIETELLFVEKDILNQWIGTYESHKNKWIMQIMEKEGQLIIDAFSMEFEIFPLSNNRFTSLDGGITLEFGVIEGKSNVTVYDSHEIIDTASKVEIIKKTHDELKEYVGNYFSDELLSTYKISLIDDQLVVKRRGEFKELLVQGFGEKFVLGAAFLSFKKLENKVVGFTIGGQRIAGVEFTKV